MKKNKLVLFASLLLIGFSLEAADMEHIISWTDRNVPPADSFIVYKSLSENSGYVEVAETADTFWTDTNVLGDERVWYKVSAVKEIGRASCRERV